MLQGRFAFDSWPKQQRLHIFTMNADGTHLRQLTSGSECGWCPAFKPDGTQIVFASPREQSDDIYVMNFDGTEQRRIMHHPVGCREPRFSPDGHQIVFCSAGEGGHAVFIMDSDGSNARQITRGTVPYDPVFTADGQSIIYNDGVGCLFIVGTDGHHHRTLFGNTTRDYEGVAVNPNGTKIAFEEVFEFYPTPDDYDHTYSIFIANLDGSDLFKMTSDFYSARSPTFSPDGSHIAFVGEKEQGQASAIYITRLDGSHLQAITDGSIHAGSLSWAPCA